MFKKFLSLVSVLLFVFVLRGFAELLYINEERVTPEKGSYLVITAIGVRDNSSDKVLDTNPPRYPGLWVYKIKVIKDLKELKSLPEQDVVCVIKVGEVYDVEKEFKKVKKEMDVQEFDSYKWKEAQPKKVVKPVKVEPVKKEEIKPVKVEEKK